MTQVTVLNGQTIFDIALQCCGDIDAAYDIAAMNNIHVTACLDAGVLLQVPPAINSHVVRYYDQNRIYPATNIEVLTANYPI